MRFFGSLKQTYFACSACWTQADQVSVNWMRCRVFFLGILYYFLCIFSLCSFLQDKQGFSRTHGDFFRLSPLPSVREAPCLTESRSFPLPCPSSPADRARYTAGRLSLPKINAERLRWPCCSIVFRRIYRYRQRRWRRNLWWRDIYSLFRLQFNFQRIYSYIQRRQCILKYSLFFLKFSF